MDYFEGLFDKFVGNSIPITANDMVNAGLTLLILVAPLVLFNLAVPFVSMMIGAIMSAMDLTFTGEYAKDYRKFRKEQYGMSDKTIRRQDRDIFPTVVKQQFRKRRREYYEEE